MILTGFGFAAPAFGADVVKIGTFDVQKILSESSAGKMIQKQLRTKFTDSQGKLKNEKNQLDEMRKALEREALVLSEEKSQEKQREYRIRVNDFKKMQQTVAQDFKKYENQLKAKMVQDIFNIVGEIGKEEGYLLILDEKTAGIFYRPDKLDITEKIIKQYNLKTSKTQ